MRISEILLENILSSFVDTDQKERQEYQSFVKTKANGDYNLGAKLYAKMKNRPANDLFGEHQRLKQFTKMAFDFNSFSESDWKNYWLLAQHCDFDRKFQQKALNIIEKFLGQNSEEYKYLYDRISCSMNGSQKYGTQTVCEPKPLM